jgi:hypothetical protein
VWSTESTIPTCTWRMPRTLLWCPRLVSCARSSVGSCSRASTIAPSSLVRRPLVLHNSRADLHCLRGAPRTECRGVVLSLVAGVRSRKNAKQMNFGDYPFHELQWAFRARSAMRSLPAGLPQAVRRGTLAQSVWFRKVNHEKRLERRCRSYPLHMPGVGRLRHASMQACAARFDLGYFGVDPLNLMEAGYARAVVAVINEVIPTQFH